MCPKWSTDSGTSMPTHSAGDAEIGDPGFTLIVDDDIGCPEIPTGVSTAMRGGESLKHLAHNGFHVLRVQLAPALDALLHGLAGDIGGGDEGSRGRAATMHFDNGDDEAALLRQAVLHRGFPFEEAEQTLVRGRIERQEADGGGLTRGNTNGGLVLFRSGISLESTPGESPTTGLEGNALPIINGYDLRRRCNAFSVSNHAKLTAPAAAQRAMSSG